MIYLSPWLLIVAVISLVYLVRIRRRCLAVSRDTIRLKIALISPINSRIQDAVNGLPTLRCLNQREHFLKLLHASQDIQTRAHITSSGGQRWTSLRIDVQAFLISIGFAAIAMFLTDPSRTPEELALTAIGLQLTIEITRQFDMAIRWSVNLETNMVSV